MAFQQKNIKSSIQLFWQMQKIKFFDDFDIFHFYCVATFKTCKSIFSKFMKDISQGWIRLRNFPSVFFKKIVI